MRALHIAVVASFAALAAAACASADPSSGVGQTSEELGFEAPPADAHVHWQKGAGPATSSSNLIDHGGKVLSASHAYTIFWGNAAAWPSDTQSAIDSLFSGLNGTAFLGVADQYMRSASISEAFVSKYADSSAPPNHSPKTSTIVNEACKVIGANGLTPDTDAIYFVYTSNFPRANFCAWHSHGTCNGVDIQVAYMPNTTGVAGCDPGNLYNCNNYSQGARSLGNVTSHEYMEAITDPDLNAWYDSSGSEIGDKCAWQFSSCVNLKNGNWQLQEEWSNSAGGCVQQ